jgi:hypothetical protein
MLIFEQDPCLAGETPASLTIHALIGTLLTPSPSDSARGSILEAHGLHVSLVTLPLAYLNSIASIFRQADRHYHTCLHITERSTPSSDLVLGDCTVFVPFDALFRWTQV